MIRKLGCIIVVFLFLATFVASAMADKGKGEITISKGQKGKVICVLLKEGADEITLKVDAASVQSYLTESDLNEVVITASVKEEEDGGLIFTFGPSGLYFEGNSAILTLKGEYAKKDATLFDENGEAIPAVKTNGNGKIMFEIPHFSNYYYDQYY